MKNNYLQYPTTIKALAEELKIICNDYKNRKINNTQIKDIIIWYSQIHNDKLFDKNGLNSTIEKIIGKKRVKLIISIINEYNQEKGE